MSDNSTTRVVMKGVREHAEDLPVTLMIENGRLCIEARTQDGYNVTLVDLLDLLEWANSGAGHAAIARVSYLAIERHTSD